MNHFLLRPSPAAVCIAWLGWLASVNPASAQFHPAETAMPALDAVAAPATEPRAAAAPEHPQVNMAAFTRAYRPLRVLDAAGKTDEAATAIERKLDQVIAEPWDFGECPLQDVVEHLRGALGVPVVLDVKACEAGNVHVDTPVTFQAQDTTTRFALRGLLDSVDMTWTIMDGVISVTTADQAASSLVIRVYPLPWGFAERRPVDAQPLLEAIQTTVAPESWDIVGGPAAIRTVESEGESLLVVRQTCAAHDAIFALLRTLHARGCAEFGDPADPWAKRRPVIRVHRCAEESARADAVLKLKDLCNASLGDAADPAATITVIGASIAVQSRSPEFQALAGQVIAAVGGVDPPPTPKADPGFAPAAGAVPEIEPIADDEFAE